MYSQALQVGASIVNLLRVPILSLFPRSLFDEVLCYVVISYLSLSRGMGGFVL